MAGNGAAFKQKTVQTILQKNFKDERTKVNSDALVLVGEVLRVFVAGHHHLQKRPVFSTALLRRAVNGRLQASANDNALKNSITLIIVYTLTLSSEAASRAASQAKKDASDEVTIDYFEKILPQLLLGCTRYSRKYDAGHVT